MSRISRRRLLAALAPAVGAGVAAKAGLLSGDAALAENGHNPQDHPARGAQKHSGAAAHAGEGHFGFPPGARVNHRANGFDPAQLVRDFDHGRTRRLASGRVLREWELVGQDKEIEVAPGVKFAAWTYNGRIPAPTLRCREGERLKI